jgi:hypothetical protein
MYLQMEVEVSHTLPLPQTLLGITSELLYFVTLYITVFMCLCGWKIKQFTYALNTYNTMP